MSTDTNSTLRRAVSLVHWSGGAEKFNFAAAQRGCPRPALTSPSQSNKPSSLWANWTQRIGDGVAGPGAVVCRWPRRG